MSHKKVRYYCIVLFQVSSFISSLTREGNCRQVPLVPTRNFSNPFQKSLKPTQSLNSKTCPGAPLNLPRTLHNLVKGLPKSTQDSPKSTQDPPKHTQTFQIISNIPKIIHWTAQDPPNTTQDPSKHSKNSSEPKQVSPKFPQNPLKPTQNPSKSY